MHRNYKTGLPCDCGFGRYLEPVSDQRLTWHILGELLRPTRNGWLKGEWGRGLYFPSTGELVTWDDATELAHSDVMYSDQFAAHPEATHLIIKPDGTVHEQGIFDRDFNESEGDIEGLVQALKAYDSKLHLDQNPDQWSFTEPVPESPIENEQPQGVQIRDDFQGGGT